MPADNQALVRAAFEAYLRGDVEALLTLVAPELEWTYLDPGVERPDPQVCRGRGEFEEAVRRRLASGLRSRLEEVVGQRDRILVVLHTPGLDAHRVRQADDRNFDVYTVRDGRVVAIRACRDRREALRLLASG